MSAFLVEDGTINKIVTYLTDSQHSWYRRQIEALGYDFSKPASIEKLAKDLFALNVKAVDCRYGDGEAEKFRPLDFCFHITPASPIAVIKALNCWHYQCSEGEDVPNHPIYLLMEKLSGQIALEIVQDLPEYETAGRWG